MKNIASKNNRSCPCHSGKVYADCCQPYLEGVFEAPTAEALMRSRYTAFTQSNEDYLRYSWHPDTCPKELLLDKQIRWLGLRVVDTKLGQISDDSGQVEFIARYKVNGKASRIHETSKFIRYNNRWVYLNGKMMD